MATPPAAPPAAPQDAARGHSVAGLYSPSLTEFSLNPFTYVWQAFGFLRPHPPPVVPADPVVPSPAVMGTEAFPPLDIDPDDTWWYSDAYASEARYEEWNANQGQQAEAGRPRSRRYGGLLNPRSPIAPSPNLSRAAPIPASIQEAFGDILPLPRGNLFATASTSQMSILTRTSSMESFFSFEEEDFYSSDEERVPAAETQDGALDPEDPELRPSAEGMAEFIRVQRIVDEQLERRGIYVNGPPRMGLGAGLTNFNRKPHDCDSLSSDADDEAEDPALVLGRRKSNLSLISRTRSTSIAILRAVDSDEDSAPVEEVKPKPLVSILTRHVVNSLTYLSQGPDYPRSHNQLCQSIAVAPKPKTRKKVTWASGLSRSSMKIPSDTEIAQVGQSSVIVPESSSTEIAPPVVVFKRPSFHNPRLRARFPRRSVARIHL